MGGLRAIAGFVRAAPIVLLFLLAGPPAASADADGGHGKITTSNAYAVFGTPKYGPGFTHFDYVNPDAPKGGKLRVADTLGFDSFNNASLRGAAHVMQTFMQDTLMRPSGDEAAVYYCLVCETISYPEDLSWVEFKLNPDATFQDGHPIRAEDIVYSINIGKNPLATPGFVRVVEPIDYVETPDPLTVRIHYKYAHNPTLPTVIAAMSIMPKHYWEKHDITRATPDPPVLAGPYKIGDHFAGRFIEFVRDPNYWAKDHPLNKGRYNFDVVRVDIYRDQQLADEAFNSGNASFRVDRNAQVRQQVDRLPAGRAGDIVQDTLPYANGTIYNSLTFNARRPFLSDRRVRKALSLAYDFEWVKDVVLGGDYGRVTSNFANSDFVAAGLPSENELKILEPYRDQLPPEMFTQPPSTPTGGSRAKMRENLLEARDLLREAGYRVKDMKLVDPKTGKPVVLELLSYSPLLINDMSLFIANLQKLGIEVNFRSMDSAQMRLRAQTFQFDMALIRPVFAPLPAPSAGMAIIWSSDAAKQPSSMNYGGISQPVIDDALLQMINATDRETVVAAMQVMDRVERFEYYSIPLQHLYPSPVGELPISYWDRFGRPEIDQTWSFDYRALPNWWWDPAKEAKLTHGNFR